jgi:hypothetical protein
MKPSVAIRNCLLSAAFLLASLASNAQFYSGSQLTFGKNRVQWDDERFWSFYRFERFETYFYQNGQMLAEYAARTAPRALEVFESRLDYTLYDNIQFIIFNNLTHLKESNIGLLSEEQYNTGGVTHIVGNKVFLYFNGDYRDFDRQIKAGIANILINQMIYGSQVSTVIKNATLMNLPPWFIQGMVNFLSEEWSPEIDNHVRDGILSGRFSRFNTLQGDDALYAGHSIWNYISDRYEPYTIPRLINMARVSRSVESSIVFVMGISFRTFLENWYTYYSERYKRDDEDREGLQEPFPIKYRKNVTYNGFTLSPDNNWAVWVSNDMGKYRVFLRNRQTGKTRRLMKQGHRLEEKINLNYPLTAWHPASRFLAIITEQQGRIWLNLLDMETLKFSKRRIFNFDQILSFSYHPAGNHIVMSTVANGQSDIVVYNLASNTVEMITRDLFDDHHPSFTADGNSIVFSSNRISDTLRTEVRYFRRFGKLEAPERQPVHDIFVYDYRSKSRLLRRLTNTPLANESRPFEFEKHYFTFLSDQSGIVNRHFARFDSVIAFIDTTTHYRYFTHQYSITNYPRGISDQRFNRNSDYFTETIYMNGANHFFIREIKPAKEIKPAISPPSSYMPLHIMRLMKVDSIPESHDMELKPRKRFILVVEEEEPIDPGNEPVDIQNYRLAGEKRDTLPVAPSGPKEFSLPKKYNYEVEYTINQLVNQADFSYINYSYQPFAGGNSPVFINPGFNALFKVGVNDLLEDYRIIGGIRFDLNFSNTEYILSYENLKKRVDKQIIFHRAVIFDELTYSRSSTNEIFYILKYPFSNVSAVRGTGILRSDRIAWLSVDIPNLQRPNDFLTWAGLKGEYIFDNTRSPGINLYYGSRMKAFAEYYQLIDLEHKNLVVLGLDYRHYQRIHRTFIWANRFAASTSFGNSRLIYYMGGVDGWLLPRFNEKINIDRTKNYTWQTLATNMRGFQQNIRNGSSFVLINSELRLPIVRYFTNRPLRSEFLNSLQIIGFGDVGTAWTGLNPYSEDNALYTQIFEQYPIKVTLTSQRDPIVGGTGFGLRSKVFGYYIRADWAWGIEDLKMADKSTFYLSFSLDF